METINEQPTIPPNPTPIQMSQTPAPVQNSSQKNRFLLFGVIGVVLLIIIGIIIISAKSFANPLLVIVGNQKIYKRTVQQAADAQYGKKITDKKVLQTILDEMVERVILDTEAKKLQIHISNEQIINSLSQNAETNISNIAPLMRRSIQYNLIKQAIMKSQTKFVSAYTITYWLPEPNDPRIQTYIDKYKQQSSDGLKALDYAEQRFSAGGDPAEVIVILYNSFPSLQSIIGFNGNFYQSIKDQNNALSAPTTYTYNSKYNGDEFYDTLFTMKPNEVKKVIRQDGTGGAVIKMISVNRGEFSNYDDWLMKKEKQYVQKKNNL